MRFDALHGRASGVADIQHRQIVFTKDSDGSQIILSLNQLEIVLEGINSHHYYFYNLPNPENKICIQDEAVLKVLADKHVASAILILEQSQKRKLKRHFILASPVVTTLVLLLAVPVLLSFVPTAWLNRIISPQQEKKLGEWMFPLIRTQHSIVETHPAQPKIAALVDLLKTANPELKELETQIYISTSQEVNAFAAPGNILVVNRGLIEKADSIEEVLGVLAHELGHVEQKHVIKSMAGGIGTLLGTIVLASFVGADGAAVITNITGFMSLKYSRADETAADHRGFHFLQRAEISPEGMISFFKKLAAQHEYLPSAMSFLSTHPASQDRVDALSQLANGYPERKRKIIEVTLEDLKSSFHN